MKIYSAKNPAQSAGTTYYMVDLDEAIDILDNDKSNCWVFISLREYGWDCLDMDNNLFGSAIIDDTLYICITDGTDVYVDGKAVNPEDALEEYDIEDLADYIVPATDKIVERYISQYELKTPDFNELAPLLIESRDFERMVKDMEEFDL